MNLNNSFLRPNVLACLTILVAGLGYVVDVYDLLIFGIVRVSSLKDLGVDASSLMKVGANIINIQMFGLLLGALFWGVLGDKVGRKRVMFWSIGLYSAATLLSGFVTNVPQYAICRFIAGFGLAAEFGIAITIAAEVSSRVHRSYAVMFVATLGTCGLLLASYVGGNFDWRTAYIVGGVAGFCLMFLRHIVMESELFHSVFNSVPVQSRGSFKILFSNALRARRYIATIVLATTLPFSTQILAVFAPEITKALGAAVPFTPAQASFYYAIGLILGDLLWIFVSQIFRKRTIVAAMSLVFFASVLIVAFNLNQPSDAVIKVIYFMIGLTVLPPTLAFLIANEQFGTNVRATVSTSAAGISRASSILMLVSVTALVPLFGILNAAAIVGSTVVVLAIFSLFFIRDGYGIDLNFVEKTN
jgi:MFS transporter, putative metabolite:H+ symporter